MYLRRVPSDAFTSVCSDSTLSVSSVVAVETIGPESSRIFPSSNLTCRLTRVSICFVVVNSVLRFVIISSVKAKEMKLFEICAEKFIKFELILHEN